MRRAPIGLSSALLITACWLAVAEATVYLTTEDALKLAFPSADDMRTEQITLTETQQRTVETALHHPLPLGPVLVYLAERQGHLLGRAMVVEEIGKYEPITFLVAVGPDGKVLDVLILVYREPRGGDVRRPNFLKQYTGKGVQDPLRVSEDIVNITGATLSARAISNGVKRAVAILDTVYSPPSP